MAFSVWAARRRLAYFLMVAGFLLLVVAVPLFKFFYKPATCFDGIQNQAELGIDCSGPCRRLCAAETLPAIVHWQRFFEVVPTVYSAVAYVENPNIKAGATMVPYNFKFFNANNELMYERTGEVNIPPKKIIAVFEHTISLPKKPGRIEFEFTSLPVWDKGYPEEPVIPIGDKELKDETTAPRLNATISNPFVFPLSNIEVTALIKDTNGNVIAASQTYIDKIDKGKSAQAVFTWPKPFPTEMKVCELPADIMLIIDRSGSMDDDGINPPQPLTDVKNAAISFVNQVKPEDQIGVVSFATEASNPPDSLLSSEFDEVKSALQKISILTLGSQNTNIGDGLKQAIDELASRRHKTRAKKVAVLLTDGEANVPTDDRDDAFPTTYALDIASKAKQSGVEMYTIGLGANVNESFLKNVATEPGYFFSAITTKELSAVYRNINSSICKIGPSVIEIITRTNTK